MNATIEKMGAPKKVITWIEELHENYNVNLKIGKDEVIIKHGCRVKQGNDLAPTLLSL